MPPTLPQANLQEIIQKLRRFLHLSSQDLRCRQRPQDFTRNRLLTFEVVAVCHLSLFKRTLGLELDWFFSEYRSTAIATSSAFCQARKKLKPEFFRALEDFFTKLVYESAYLTWKDMRLVATDGSTALLPDNPGVRIGFPVVTNQKGDSTQARILCYYDVLNQHALKVQMGPIQVSENEMAQSCLGFFGPDDLLIYDRCFPSWNLFYQHNLSGIHFLMRCKVTFSTQVVAFVSSRKPEEIVRLHANAHTIGNFRKEGVTITKDQYITVRFLRIELEETGDFEILVTDLLDTGRFPHSDFKELYFRRWGVETFFDRMKNKLQLQVFSGKSIAAIKADFSSLIFLANLESLFIRDVQADLDQTCQGRKHGYQPNWNKTLGLIKSCLVVIFLKAEYMEKIEELKEKIAQSRNLEPVRKGRRFPRKKKVKHLNSKHDHPPNYKRAI